MEWFKWGVDCSVPLLDCMRTFTNKERDCRGLIRRGGGVDRSGRKSSDGSGSGESMSLVPILKQPLVGQIEVFELVRVSETARLVDERDSIFWTRRPLRIASGSYRGGIRSV